MAAVRLDTVMTGLVILAGALCASAAKPGGSVMKQAADLFTPINSIVNEVEQAEGVPIPDLRMEVQGVSRKARALLSILPRKVLELMANLEQVLNTTDQFLTLPETDFTSLTFSFDRMLTALSATQDQLKELLPTEMSLAPVQTPLRAKRSARAGSCCKCCGRHNFCGSNCGCACG